MAFAARWVPKAHSAVKPTFVIGRLGTGKVSFVEENDKDLYAEPPTQKCIDPH